MIRNSSIISAAMNKDATVQTQRQQVRAAADAAIFVEAVREKIRETVRPILEGVRQCALVDYPNYPNAGDQAIWLGQVKLLKEMGIEIVYRCSRHSFSKDILKAALPEGLIMIQGGGNLGDLWPKHQNFREKVLLDFPDHKIVQFPQSIHFEDEQNLKRCKEIIAKHKDFTLLVRDQRSFDFARANFKCSSILCPDMAFYLGKVERPEPSSKRFLALLRRDKEKNISSVNNLFQGLCHDWSRKENATVKLSGVLHDLEVHFPKSMWLFHDIIWWLLNLSSQSRLKAGMRLLSQGKYVMTDRLHASILCVLMGIPNVCLDNSYGKLKDYYETWTNQSKISRFAPDFDAAMRDINAFEETGL